MPNNHKEYSLEHVLSNTAKILLVAGASFFAYNAISDLSTADFQSGATAQDKLDEVMKRFIKNTTGFYALAGGCSIALVLLCTAFVTCKNGKKTPERQPFGDIEAGNSVEREGLTHRRPMR